MPLALVTASEVRVYSTDDLTHKVSADSRQGSTQERAASESGARLVADPPVSQVIVCFF
jgi:hypothetical protein